MAQDREGTVFHLIHGDKDENLEYVAAIRVDNDMLIIQIEERTTMETQPENTCYWNRRLRRKV